MNNDYKNFMYKKLSQHRKELHELAEIGNKEYKTSSYIKNYLQSIEVDYDEYLETAVVGKINGKNPKKTIAFRADIDALSANGKARHLCGHDGHMSILLSFIEYIKDNIDKLNDNIVFIFQPAEEGPGGALPLIKEGIIEKYGIEEIYGLHVQPQVKEGYVGIREGYFLAQAGELNIDIIAKGGHGGIPNEAIDGIVIAGNLVNTLQSIISRNISPLDNGVLTIGKIVGGTRRNIIAENIRLEGGIRAFKPSVYEIIKTRVREIAKGFEVSYNCKINVDIVDDYPAVNNNKILYDEFMDVIDNKKIIIMDPMMISEDFSYYQKYIPGLFFMLGVRNEEKGYINSLHNENFNFEEKSLITGIEIYIELLKHKKSLL